MEKKRRIQWKRRRPKHYLMPAQMIERLAALEICALADCNSIWLPVDPHTCDTLRACCIGTLDGHQGAATALSLSLGLDPAHFTMAVRLAPEEAYFLHYVLGCLQVYCPAPPGMASDELGMGVEHVELQKQGDAPPAAAAAATAGAAPQAAALAGVKPVQQVQPMAIDSPAEHHVDSQGQQGQQEQQEQPHEAVAAAAAADDGPADQATDMQAAGAALAQQAQHLAQLAQPPLLLQLDPESFWQWCCSCSSSGAAFPVQYIGYHHFRSKGWLPRSGLIYGCDYVLYQLHPGVVHSDYGALLVPLQGRQQMELHWQELQIANRLISQVGKRLVLLYLHSEVPLEGELCSSPACLEHVTAEERIVARWVPDATRD